MSLTNIARLLLGFFFLIFGLNGFFHFLSGPTYTGIPGALMIALNETKYFFPFLSTLETLCGFFLLMDLYVPLALVILAPILGNILLFHFFLARGLIFLPVGLAVVYLYVAFYAKPYAEVIRQIFRQPERAVALRISKKKEEGFQPS